MTFTGLKKEVMCKGFKVRRTLKGFLVTTNYGRTKYYYPKDKMYDYVNKEYSKGVECELHRT